MRSLTWWSRKILRAGCVFGRHEWIVIGTMGTYRFCGICDRWEQLRSGHGQSIWTKTIPEIMPPPSHQEEGD